MLFDKRGQVIIKDDEIRIEMDDILTIRFFFKRRTEFKLQLEHYLDINNVFHLPTLFNLENWARQRKLAYFFGIKGWFNVRSYYYRISYFFYSIFGRFISIRKK